MNPITKRPEPLVNTALITALVAATLTLLQSFGVPISDVQQEAINQFLVVLAPIIVAVVARRWVTPASDPRAE